MTGTSRPTSTAKVARARKPRVRPSAGRAAKAQSLIGMALALEAEPRTYDQMEADFGISRSTAYRILEDLRVLFGTAFSEEMRADDGGMKKCFSVRVGASLELAGFSSNDVLLVREAGRRFQRSNRPADATRMEFLANNVMVGLRRPGAAKVDVAALLEREGLAMRPGPKPGIDGAILSSLRDAILAARVIEIDYVSRTQGTRARRAIEPHGILYGNRNYVVGYPEGREARSPTLFALPGIKSLVVTKRNFTFRPGFDMQAFASASFGVWHGDEVAVRWRFAAHRASDVMETRFHASETKTVLGDGSVEVCFTAHGQLEMLFHLFTWEDAILEIDPPELRDRYRVLIERVRAAIDRMGDAPVAPPAPRGEGGD
jgi:predicted DNA-binding transcriptional regulator YafY